MIQRFICLLQKECMVPLPVQAQLSVLNGITVDDYNGDGNLDVLINGNDYGTEPVIGRYDALNGWKGMAKATLRLYQSRQVEYTFRVMERH